MAASGGGPLGRGLDISLAALRRQDPYIQCIMDVASQVALYTFSHQTNEWEKTDVEGTLFVHSRSASPKHGFTIMNRLSMENRTEPITKDLDFQLQDPFLLYRNARFHIYGIWFYEKEECQRIAELMKNLTQQEQLKAQQAVTTGASPMMLHSDGKEVDILQMLSKAKDEYAKCKPPPEPKAMTSSSAIHSNPNLIKPIAVKPSDTSPHMSGAQQSKSGDTEPQHLSLTALFGKLEKTPVEGQEHTDPSKMRPAVVRSLSYEEPRRQSESGEKQLCPAIQKLMVRGADLIPLSEIPEKRESQIGNTYPPGDVFSSLFMPIEDATFPAQELDSGKSLLHKLTSIHSIVPHPEPGMTPSNLYYSGPINNTTTSAPGKNSSSAPLHYYDGLHQSQRTLSNLPTMPLSSQLPSSPGTISPHELLKKLNLVRQDQQYQANTKPALAAKFPLVPQPVMKQTWVEKLPLGDKPNPQLQVISPQRIPATVSPAALLSPLVFTQTSTQKPADLMKPTLSDKDATTNLLPLTDMPTNNVGTQSSVLTKCQLRDTLLHLIQNDESFLNTIYESYLSVLKRRGAPTGMP